MSSLGTSTMCGIVGGGSIEHAEHASGLQGKGVSTGGGITEEGNGGGADDAADGPDGEPASPAGGIATRGGMAGDACGDPDGDGGGDAGGGPAGPPPSMFPVAAVPEVEVRPIVSTVLGEAVVLPRSRTATRRNSGGGSRP